MNFMKKNMRKYKIYLIFSLSNLTFWLFFFIVHIKDWHINQTLVVLSSVLVFKCIFYYFFERFQYGIRTIMEKHNPYYSSLNNLLKGNFEWDETLNRLDTNASKRIEKIQKGQMYFNQANNQFSQDIHYLVDQIKEKNVNLLDQKNQIDRLVNNIQEMAQKTKMIMNHTYDPLVLLENETQIVWKNNSFIHNYLEMAENNYIENRYLTEMFKYRGKNLGIVDDQSIKTHKIKSLKESIDFHFKHITLRNIDLKNNVTLIQLVDNLLLSMFELIGPFYLKLFTLSERKEWVEKKSNLRWHAPQDFEFDFLKYMDDEWMKHPKLNIFEMVHETAKTVIIAPLEIEGKLQAAYGFVLKNALNESDKQTIKLFYNQFTMVVQREVIYQKLRNQYFNTIEALVNVIEAKDKYTEGHSRRVSRFAVEIAKKMGYSNEEVERVEISGLLHDVGKIGIQQAILVKQGRLTDSEYEEMKLHPEKAIQILEAIDLDSDIMDGILYHHLRHDLKGYPKVTLEKLPVFASIIGTADAFDAITSARSYSGKRSIEEAVEELNKYKGSQFDPEIVAVMIQLIDENRDRIDSIINDDAYTKRDIKGEYHVLSSAI